ncbi:hypothetical protein [Deinococcus murrayi]|uniref:hypothetical protein n=1 Tax=Deinococcus murrayi TaxID=68910 RepID=UPI00054CEBCB|nr:hypothetical protein [Deinococcus murrayi]
MRPRGPQVLALFAALAASAPVLAGGAGAPPTATTPPVAQRNLFFPNSVFQFYPGERVPFTVEIDLSRSRALPGGPVRVMVVAVTPDRWTLNLVSRPVMAGEKVRWQGTLPKAGVLVINVLGGYGSVDTGDRAGAIALFITGDEKGNLVVSDGNCPPRASGICGGPR